MLYRLLEIASRCQIASIKRKYNRGLEITKEDLRGFYLSKAILEARFSKRYSDFVSDSLKTQKDADYVFGCMYFEISQRKLRKAENAMVEEEFLDLI